MSTIHRRFTGDRNAIHCQESAPSAAPGPQKGPVSPTRFKCRFLAIVKGMMELMVEGLSPWARPSARRSYDLIVVGSGPAGLAAALCAAGEGLNNLIIKVCPVDDRQGKVVRCGNWLPPVPQRVKVKTELAQIIGQANCIKLAVLSGGIVTSMRTEADLRVVTVEAGEEYWARSVLLASGVHLWRLGDAGEAEVIGVGTSLCVPGPGL